MSAIEKALLEATGQKPQKKGEDRQKYLLRLADHANNKLSDDAWDALERVAGVQDWVKAAIEADNADKVLADFPDIEEDAQADTGAASEDNVDADADEGAGDEPAEGEEDMTAKKSSGAKGKKPAAKKAAPAAKKPAAPAKAGGKKPISMRRALKQMVVKNPGLDVDTLVDRLEKKGYGKPSRLTVTTIRADTRDTIKVLNEAELANIEL